jgi:hypothetical protein
MKVPWNYLGPDPEPDDPDTFITADGKCSNCGYAFGPGELDLPTPIFVVEESGVSPGLHFGPDVHWAAGYIVCPNCSDHLPYETSN